MRLVEAAHLGKAAERLGWCLGEARGIRPGAPGDIGSGEGPMPILSETGAPDPLGVGEVPNLNDHQPHAKRPRRASLQSQIETNRQALSSACRTRLPRLSNAWS